MSVSLDENKANWLKAVSEDQLPWTQVSDLKGWTNEAAKLYEIKAIPQNFLIDPTGKIIDKTIRGVDLNEKLNKLFVNK